MSYTTADFRRDYERELVTAANGEIVAPDLDGRLRDTLGRYGYTAHFTGAYVCYTCGHMCECGDSVDTDSACDSCGVVDPVGVEIMHLNTCELINN